MNNQIFSKWMENLPNALINLPICDLAIPGSHDSFTHSIKRTSDISPDADTIIIYLTKLFGRYAKSLVYRWAVTQDLNTLEQLAKGIRYFDIRLAFKVKDGIIYTCHSLYGQPILDDLKLIKEFLQINTKEVVILDFNHYYQFSKMEHLKFLNILHDVFGDLIVPFHYLLPSLSELWKVNKRVFIFYRFDDKLKDWIWPGNLIPSPWGNTDNVNNLINFLDLNYKNRRHQVNQFYVTQGILTPTLRTILRHLFTGNLRNTLAKKLAPKFMRWLSKTRCGSRNTNCVIIDFFNDTDFVSEIIDLNIKNSKSI